MPLIEMENVSFRYKNTWILNKISCSIKKGEFLGIIGPNGSGKTTLLKCANKILDPQEGSILIKGTNIKTMSQNDLARLAAFVVQETSEIFSFTVTETVLMGRTPHLGKLQFEGKKDLAIAKEAMLATDTLPLSDRSMQELSGGERQRVLIARALAQEPLILYLDEATAHLDIRHQAELFGLLKKLNREKNLTVIAVTHDFNLASLYCDSIVLLNAGSIQSIGSPAKVITESNIRKIYETDVIVDSHPVYELPRLSLMASHLSDQRKPVQSRRCPATVDGTKSISSH